MDGGKEKSKGKLTMSKYFGTDGFRGEAGITLTADHAYKVGRFLGWYYNALRERNGDNESARIVIGKDTRRSSYMFEYSLVAGLTASGADAICFMSLQPHPWLILPVWMTLTVAL